MGHSLIFGPFSIAMLNYQRVFWGSEQVPFFWPGPPRKLTPLHTSHGAAPWSGTSSTAGRTRCGLFFSNVCNKRFMILSHCPMCSSIIVTHMWHICDTCIIVIHIYSSHRFIWCGIISIDKKNIYTLYIIQGCGRLAMSCAMRYCHQQNGQRGNHRKIHEHQFLQ